MPNEFAGYYFLTVLSPIKRKAVLSGEAPTDFESHAQLIRRQLDAMPNRETSPFTRNTTNHLARWAVIDDVRYNGRLREDPIKGRIGNALKGLLPWNWFQSSEPYDATVPQEIDQLQSQYLLFATDLDGGESDVDPYLRTLWKTMEPELRDLYGHCVGFEEVVKDAATFVEYIRACQVETTMPFNDYADHPKKGEQPLYTDASLPAVLKALYVQQRFTEFAIANQGADDETLYRGFGEFLEAVKPSDLSGPTQSPGVVETPHAGRP